MFEMNAQQQQAAMDAMNGLSAESVSNSVHILIGALALCVFFLVLIGNYRLLQTGKIDFGEMAGRIAVTGALLTLVALLIVT